MAFLLTEPFLNAVERRPSFLFRLVLIASISLGRIKSLHKKKIVVINLDSPNTGKNIFTFVCFLSTRD